MLLRTKFVSNQNEEALKTLKVDKKEFPIIIQKEVSRKTPFWIWIVSILGGILLLVAIILIFYKLGFFTRKMKQELAQKKRETMIAAGQSNPAYESTQTVS